MRVGRESMWICGCCICIICYLIKLQSSVSQLVCSCSDSVLRTQLGPASLA